MMTMQTALAVNYSPPTLEVQTDCSVIPMGTIQVSFDDTPNVELPPIEDYSSGGPIPAGYRMQCDEFGCRLVSISTAAPLLATMGYAVDSSAMHHTMGRGSGRSGIPILRLLFNSERRQERRMARQSGRREGGLLQIFSRLFSRVGARSGGMG